VIDVVWNGRVLGKLTVVPSGNDRVDLSYYQVIQLEAPQYQLMKQETDRLDQMREAAAKAKYESRERGDIIMNQVPLSPDGR